MAFVLVEFDFEYKAKDGRHICIKPNERYVLVSKTNDHWWRVSKDQDSKPFYIPAEYVKEVSAPPGTSSGPKKTESPKSLTKRKPADATGKNKAVNTTKRTSLDTKTARFSLVYSRNTNRCVRMSATLYSYCIVLSHLQVQNENLRSAVYVNVAELRQSISESPPSDPSPCSPSYLKQEGWEVHVDQESGQEYYYHPDTGSTTWDNPFLDSPTDPEPLPPEVPFPPPSPQSDWASDWEQLVDETTGQPYFYNHMSGETSWDPPEQQSLYPSPMEPMSTNQIVPEFTVELKGATIGWATKDKSSKKNVLELKGKNGVEFLIQYDTESIIHDWHKILKDTIQQLVSPGSDQNHQQEDYQEHHSEEEDGDLYEKIGNVDRDEKPVRTKLMKFLMKRPTLQSVKEKGYIRENVFGCHLHTLCAHERTTVPSFVDKCIKAVERRGLDIDGLYRVSGNLAVIQKLRFKADHGEELDLEDGQWEDVHVITGALKLFFRELPEPLFPFSHFNEFVTFTQTHCFVSLSLSLSLNDRVIEYGEDNRMTVQNVAIVFGPTLLRPETETANITMHMVFQNQIVEFILNEYSRLFYSS
uniref:Rho GTPase activating protein 27 n=1 Tax=Poecilia latipinna TaxID=48699 RepID=A0A3B3UJP6_9TELE